MPCTGFYFALIFSRLVRGPDPLVLSPMIVNWFLNETESILHALSLHFQFLKLMTKQGSIGGQRHNTGFVLSISCHFWMFVLERVTSLSRSRNDVTLYASWTFLVKKNLFKKELLLGAPHCSASLRESKVLVSGMRRGWWWGQQDLAAVLNWWTCPGDFGFLVRNGNQHASGVQAAWSQVHSLF